jgi:protein arginine kinase activator
MHCQKCARSAVVHLTEIVTESAPGGGQTKRRVEIHLCLEHAVAAGLLTPLAGATAGATGKVALQPLTPNPQSTDAPATPPASPAETATPGAIERGPADAQACPVCGMSWEDFKRAGVMGCGHDYEQFAPKLLPLLKRAQEGATQHVGKVPNRQKSPAADRQFTTLRLRRELQKAIEAENYEQAAQLRDQLRTLEQN